MISIETSIVKGLLFDHEYASKVVPHLKNEFFDGAHREIFDLYFSLYDKYNKVPTIDAMVVGLQGRALSESVYEATITELKEAIASRSEKPDTQWLIDETEKYCTDKAVFNALYKSISILEGREKTMDKHAIPQILEEALAIGFEHDVGASYLDDVQKRLEYYTNPQNKLEFPLKALNLLTNMGALYKTLNVFLAGTNVGKSAMLCYLAGEFMKAGKNVLYITAEMSEESVAERIDANLLDIKTDDLKRADLDKEWFKSKMDQLKARVKGKLYIKEYPTSSAHVGHFRYLIKELKQKCGFTPDVIMVDYINIIASSRYKAGSGANSYTVVKATAEELRGLAVETKTAIFTATQTTREGYSSKSPDLTSTSESFGLPATADWMCAIVTNEELMDLNQQLLLLLKTRYGNKKGAKQQLVSIDFDKMRYSDVTQAEPDVQGVMQKVGTRTPTTNKPTTTGIPNDINWDE